MVHFVRAVQSDFSRRFLTVGLIMGSLSACSTLPSNGPTGRQIVRSSKSATPAVQFRIVDINAASVAEHPMPSLGDNGVRQLARNAAVDRVGPGDVLNIQIFEVGSGLFSGGRISLGQGEALGTPTVNGEKLGGGLMVAQDGTISVPYVGRLHVDGLTAAEIQDMIVAGLRGKSQSPQVLVSIQQNVSNSIYVSGSVAKPGRQVLTLAYVHLLDAVADAGGYIAYSTTGSSTATGVGPQDFVVRLSRDGRTVEQGLDEIHSGSPDDVLLVPGDRIELIHQPKTFVVMGATDKVTQMPFESRDLSLAEALARIGGPSDSRADPRYVFVFRDIPALRPRSDAHENGVLPAASGTTIPTVYRLNLMDAQSYFLAQRFAMENKDLVYLANASANQPQKLAQIVGALFSPVFSIAAVTR